MVWLHVCEEGGAGGGGGSVEAEAAEGAVDLAAGADALDDLLAEVAAFAEVEGAGSGGLLGEVAIADVGAEEGCAFEDAEVVEGLGGGVDGVSGEELGSDGGECGLIGPDLEAGDERAVGVDHGQVVVAPEDVGEGGRGACGGEGVWMEEVWLKEVEGAEDLGCVWAGDEEAFAGGGDVWREVGELDVVHDDEAVEKGGEGGDLGRGGLEEEVVGFGEDVAVALDAALRVEEEVVAAGAWGEVSEGVGDHAIEPPDAVGAGDFDPAGVLEGDEASGGEEGVEL